jgi:hypothetical protein
MSKPAIRFVADSDRAKAPDFSIPKTAAEHHDAAAQYYDEAARHRRVAAKQDQAGHREKAADYAQLAYAHRMYGEHVAEAAMAHAKKHTG